MRLLLLTIFLLATAATEPAQLEIRFIGNEAFEITDGNTTILSDFPYESGAFGYMSYATEMLTARKNATCLITHQHKDHFDPALQSKVGCKVLGPEDVLTQIPVEARWKWKNNQARINDVVINAIPTPHGEIDHYSYRVNWKNRSLYFTGDTDEPSDLLKQPKLDILFITPWLAKKIPEQKLKALATKVVIYHHTANEQIDCSICLTLQQGETIRI